MSAEVYNPLKSLCMLFMPKGCQLYGLNIVIGREVLNNTKYFGISFCEIMK